MANKAAAVKTRNDQRLKDAALALRRTPASPTYINAAGQTRTAQYIADMILELRSLARGAELPHLVHFLEMAFHEAFNQSNKGK